MSRPWGRVTGADGSPVHCYARDFEWDEWLVLLHALEAVTNSTKITLTYNARAAAAEQWRVAWNLGEQTGSGPVEALQAALASLDTYYGFEEWDR